MKNLILTILLIALLPLAIYAQCGNCNNHPTGNGAPQTEMSNAKTQKYIFANAGKAYKLNNDYSVKFRWQSKPKIGTKLLIVELYNKDNKLSNALNVSVNSYMPSMRGSHDTGHQPMKLNKNKAYVMPVNFMMLGDWELELKFNQGKTNIYTGYIQLKI